MGGPTQLEVGVGVQVEDRLRFEIFISNLSARFVRLPSNQVHEEIERALQEVTEFFHADRCGLADVSRDQKVASLTHAWYGEGVQRVALGTNLAEGHTWSFKRLVEEKQFIAFDDLSELPPDAASDLPAYKAMGAHSSLIIPLFTGKEVRHIMILQTTKDEAPALSREFIPRLQLLGEILVNALYRKNADDALRESEARLSLAAASAQLPCGPSKGATDTFGALTKGVSFWGSRTQKT